LISAAILSRIGYHATRAMPRQLQFFTIRYSPNIVTGKFINIAVVLLDPSGDFCGVRFISDWQRVRDFDPDADIEMLEALGRDIEGKFGRGEGEEILKTMEDSFSNAVQLSPGMVCLVEDPANEIEKLASSHLRESAHI
jgi:Protein of unknown function (DUF3037)